MITLSNGHQLDFLVSSGALGYDGLGWPWDWPLIWLGIIKPEEFTVVTKTLTRQPRKGNLKWYQPWSVLRPISGGWVNAVGLTNPGIEWWLEECKPRIKRSLKIIVSIYPTSPEDCQEMCRLLDECPLVGIEINASCPNVSAPNNFSSELVEICKVANQSTSHPLLIKISYLHPSHLIQEVSPYVEAVHAINSVPWHIVFPNKKSPLAKYGGGGVSGPIIQPFVEETIARLRASIDIPIIVGGGINSLEVIRRYQELGASAFGLGTLFLNQPWQPNRFVKKWRSKS